jgi:hypothetical protein
MRNALKLLLSAALASGAMGCGDFLSGPGIDEDPNNIRRLTRPGPLVERVSTRADPARGLEAMGFNRHGGR